MWHIAIIRAKDGWTTDLIKVTLRNRARNDCKNIDVAKNSESSKGPEWDIKATKIKIKID